MKRILVTGATGHLGRGIVEHLLKLKPSGEIAVLARDPGKAVDLSTGWLVGDLRNGRAE